MSWALFVTDSRTTVATEWKVDAAAASQLMTDFHSGLRGSLAGGANPPGKAEALRQAALSSLHRPQSSHPFCWAGFVMLGDGF